MLVHRRVTPSIKFVALHLYTWVERSPVRMKCLAQEYNTLSLARAGTQTSGIGGERINHDSTAPPHGEIERKRCSKLLCFDLKGSVHAIKF